MRMNPYMCPAHSPLSRCLFSPFVPVLYPLSSLPPSRASLPPSYKRSLHNKLSSPERRKPSPMETKIRTDEKQRAAKEHRDRLSQERESKARVLADKVRTYGHTDILVDTNILVDANIVFYYQLLLNSFPPPLPLSFLVLRPLILRSLILRPLILRPSPSPCTSSFPPRFPRSAQIFAVTEGDEGAAEPGAAPHPAEETRGGRGEAEEETGRRQGEGDAGDTEGEGGGIHQ